MGSYKISLRRSAARELEAIPKRELARVVSRIGDLASNARPAGCEKLSGQERYRIRQGAYRIVYAIDDESKAIDIVKIGHRREVYRDRH